MAGGTVEVSHSYVAQAEDEHTLRVGDIITNVVQVADGWCEGFLNGHKALFPDNFVRPAPAANPVSSASSIGISASGEKSFAAPRGKQNGPAGGAGVSELRNKIGNIIGGPPPSAARGGKRTGNKKVRVTHQYTSQHEDELSLEVGAVIDVLNTEGEEGWWEGSLNGKIGVFPSNFAELIEDIDEKSGDVPSEIKGRKVEGVGFGNIFAGAPIMLRSRQPEKKEGGPGAGEANKVDAGAARMSVKGKVLPSHPGSVAANPTKPELPRAKALFPYNAENEDELSLAEGDVVIVLEQELEDIGWWKGDLNGKVGVFPDNFVELLPPTPTVAPPEEKSKKPLMSPSSAVPNKGVKNENHVKPSASKPAWVDKKAVKIPLDNKLESDHKSTTGRQTESISSSSSNEKLSSSSPVAAGKPAPLRPPVRPAIGPSARDNVVEQPAGGGRNNVTGASISLEQCAELQREISQLKEAIEQTKRSQEKRFMELMFEIDEEKKTRLSLQVEIDRLKKFITN